MIQQVLAPLLIFIYLFPLRVFCSALRSPGAPTAPSVSIPTQAQQQALSGTSAKDCSSEINRSFSRTYDWSSPSALELAQCLLTHNPPRNQCVFYTREARPLAIQYALETSSTTIYDVYPPLYFNTSTLPASRWRDSGHLRDLFRITSKAYAIACSGSATLVMPEDEEPCPDSIWVTDEYDAIRNGLSRIELPVWKVSWSLDRVRGAWGWVRRILSAATGGSEVGIGKRDVRDAMAEVWEDMQERYVEPVAEDVRAKVEAVKQQWGWRWEVEDDDMWALAEGKCDLPQR